MLHLQSYGADSSSGEEDEAQERRPDTEDPPLHLTTTLSMSELNKTVCAAPPVVAQFDENESRLVRLDAKELTFNPKYEELYAPAVGPENPFKGEHERAPKNTPAGFVEAAHISDFQFENQRRTFASYGHALDPSVSGAEGETPAVDGVVVSSTIVPAEERRTVFESSKLRPLDKRKRLKNDDPSDVNGFLGPWGGYVDEKRVAKPEGEDLEAIAELMAKRQKRRKVPDDKPFEEKSVLHVPDAVDYQGRTFLAAPNDVGVNLKSGAPPQKCFLPKSHIFTWKGHTKGISAVKWFPKTAHLVLSAGMDCRVKIWEVYRERRCIRTYYGHRQAVRDICFNNDGNSFLSAGYDRYIKLWNTETGACISHFSSRKIPYCVKFNPDRDKQHLFVAGTSDKKIICWDSRSGDVVQEYDRHLGAVNSITFVDENRRFVTTSDDKSLRVWEWDIPVDMKYIADPTMHSMPFVTLAPNGKWLACQSMDNKVVVFSALNRFKMNRKKIFSGHMVAGYACGLDYSPDMSYLASGDADGKCYIWDWKTTKLFKKWKAHDGVCIATLWHPHEASKVLTAGWDGVMKYWD